MSGSAIEPLAPGERPTEEGWYIAQDQDGDHMVVQLGRSSSSKGGFYVLYTGTEMDDDLDDARLSFIARIYPDRIEGREG